MSSITVFSVATTRYVVEAYHEVMQSLKIGKREVIHIGLADDLWYGGTAYNVYRTYGYKAFKIPRISELTTPWWRTPNVMLECQKSLRTILAFLSDLVDRYRPDVFLLADDTGPLEVAFIRAFNERNIPVIYLEHGFGFTLPQETRLGYRIFRHLQGKIMLRTKIKRIMGGKSVRNSVESTPDIALPTARPSGHNGPYTICSYCGLTKDIMIKHGVDPKTIQHTGFPYFDQVVRCKDNHVESSVLNKRILIVSGGNILFGRDEYAMSYYIFLLEVIGSLVNDYSISIRFKPGEDSSLLPSSIREKLQQYNISYDDNTVPSYKAIQSFGLVMGQPSTLLQEAVILGVPAVVLKFPRYTRAARNYKITLASILRDYLGVLTLEHPAKAKRIVSEAMSISYQERIIKKLEETGRYVYDNDGKAGCRVAQVILDVLAKGQER